MSVIDDTEAEVVDLPEMDKATGAEGETPPPADDEQEEVIVTIGDEPAPEPEPAQQGAPEWVKEVRKRNRELEREVKTLRRAVEDRGRPVETNPTLGPEPTLEAVDYDTDRYRAEMAKWLQQQAAVEQHQARLAEAEKTSQQAWQAKLDAYAAARDALKAKDFEDAEAAVMDALSISQQGLVVAYAQNPALMIYALGKNPKRAAELAAYQDAGQFAYALGQLETQLKVQNRKPTTSPERAVPTGSAPKSGTVDSTLDRLRAEAERTGDYSKVFAHKRQAKAKARG